MDGLSPRRVPAVPYTYGVTINIGRLGSLETVPKVDLEPALSRGIRKELKI
jgi:hypothetical protein